MYSIMHSGSSPAIYHSRQILDEVKQVYAWLDSEVCGSIHTALYPNCTDVLIDVRSVFQHYVDDLDADRLFQDFYALLPRLERSYYLVSYRIRSWLGCRFCLRVEDLRHCIQVIEVDLDTTKKSFYDIKRDIQIDYLCACYFSHQPTDVRLSVKLKH